jgi:hypothetical protein
LVKKKAISLIILPLADRRTGLPQPKANKTRLVNQLFLVQLAQWEIRKAIQPTIPRKDQGQADRLRKNPLTG